jgi:hypothetical protein
VGGAVRVLGAEYAGLYIVAFDVILAVAIAARYGVR